MVFPAPLGSTQPCCHPLTTIGVSRVPSAVCATQPGLTLSGTTSTRAVGAGSVRTSRRSGPHASTCTAVVAAGGGEKGVAAGGGEKGVAAGGGEKGVAAGGGEKGDAAGGVACGVVSWTPSTTNP